MKNEYIKNLINITRNEMADQKAVREAEERLSMVNQKDYYETCEELNNR